MIGRLLKYVAISFICCAAPRITPSAVVGAGSTPCTLSRIIQCAFIPDGYFYLKNSPPDGFEDFDYIALLLSDTGKARPLADSRLYTMDGKSYKLIKLGKFVTHSSGRGITFEFETEVIKGISYQFTGKFTSICNFAEDETDPQKSVAEGRLTKFRDSREVASAEVQITYSKSPRPRS